MASIDLSSISDTYASHCYDQLESSLPSSRPIYGREHEMAVLRKTYERLLKTKKVQTVIVRGVSGSGKTALIDALRDPVIDTNGYFVAGKYFQNAEVQEPYSAIMAAFSDLCDLLVQSDDFDIDRRRGISNALGPHANMLLKAITNISALVGDVDKFAKEPTSFAKFKVACKTFLDSVASDEHPIVIFLDDIQWADEGSKELMQMLLQESGMSRNIMFILAYRTEEVEQVATVFPEIVVPNSTEIVLSNLDTAAIHHMVASMLGSDSNQIELLGNIVTKRTCGNPMHVAMFMEIIQQESLLVYCEETNLWQIDVARIQEEIMVSETLAALLIRKIEQFSSGDAIKEVLKVASLMGYSFDELVLLKVMDALTQDDCRILSEGNGALSVTNDSHTTVRGSLLEATKQGFIEKVRAGYQFTHDKIQSAFQSFVAESDEGHLHELIGEAFFAYNENEGSSIYKAAVHLNQVPGFLSDQEKREGLACINLEAAKYSKERHGFNEANTLLRKALECLGTDERWNTEHSLTFEIMEALAKIQFIVGELETCKETIRETLCRNDISAEMNINLQLLDVKVRVLENDIDSALLAANRALQSTLGIKMPRKVSIRHVAMKLIKVKWMLRNKTDEDILNLPHTENGLVAKAVHLLVHLCTFCLLKNKQDTAVFFALLATELTLTHGLSQYSSSAFTVYGVAEAALGKIDRAYRFGRIALEIIDRMECREAQCRTVGLTSTLLAFYRQPMSTLVGPLYEAALSGLQYEDVSYATFCLSQCFSMHLSLATNMATLEDTIRSVYNIVRDIGQESLIIWLQPFLQLTINMQNDITCWDNISVLSGEIMNEEDYFDRAQGNDILVLTGLLIKAIIAVLFNQFVLAASIYERTKSYGADTVRLSYAGPDTYLSQARLYYELYERTGNRSHLRKARKFKKMLYNLASDGSPRAVASHSSLIAMESIFKKRIQRDSELRDAYICAIDSFDGTESHSFVAILSEKAGFAFAKRGLDVEAEAFFNRALHIYNDECGLVAKSNQLRQQSTSALSHRVVETPRGVFVNVPAETSGL